MLKIIVQRRILDIDEENRTSSGSSSTGTNQQWVKFNRDQQ